MRHMIISNTLTRNQPRLYGLGNRTAVHCKVCLAGQATSVWLHQSQLSCAYPCVWLLAFFWSKLNNHWFGISDNHKRFRSIIETFVHRVSIELSSWRRCAEHALLSSAWSAPTSETIHADGWRCSSYINDQRLVVDAEFRKESLPFAISCNVFYTK